MEKIFSLATGTPTAPAPIRTTVPEPPTTVTAGATGPAAPPPAPGTSVPTASAVSSPAEPSVPAAGAPKTNAPVDVAAVLDGLAAKNPESLDWKKSIVDLMKLVGMDSSLAARKELATELKYSGDMNDSATMNEWLHKAVLQKLADNGGKVPPELLSK